MTTTIATPTLTLASTWSPTSCPVSTDVWEIYMTTSAVFFLLGPWTATSECAPSSYNPTVPYYAYSCPTGYTSACAHGVNEATTVCCPTARVMSCATTSPKIYDSLTMSCLEKFSSSYTAIVTTTSIFATAEPTGTHTVVFTPSFDAINAFQIEYVSMTASSTSTSSASMITTSSATATTTSASSTSTSSSSSSNNTSSSGLSAGAIAGIVVAAVAFIVIIGLVWNRARITAWLHRKTAPRSDKLETPPSQYNPYVGNASPRSPVELSAGAMEAAELPPSSEIHEKDTH